MMVIIVTLPEGSIIKKIICSVKFSLLNIMLMILNIRCLHEIDIQNTAKKIVQTLTCEYICI